ncbi:hypothetical protein ACROYT_G022103, partial [Oculina patagonica]
TCFGQVKTNLYNVLNQLMPGTTQKLLEHSASLDLDNCFIASQKFDAERVGSMPEDVPIIQPIRQPVNSEDNIMRDVGLSFECDYNLCFKDISASENLQSNTDLKSLDKPLQLHVIPSLPPGHVELEVPPNVDWVPGLQNLCVKDRGLVLLSSELLIEQMYNVLTIITAILNVHRIHKHHKDDAPFNEEDCISLVNYLQYVGQAGPAVHVVMCIGNLSPQKGRHLFLTEDVSMSVPCKEWPSCAKEWPTRDRTSGWPSKQLIEKVTQNGCHVVPKFDASEKSSAASSSGEMSEGAASSVVTPKTQWRYSFSLAERTLMTSITDEQKMCYLIFKYLFSRYIKLESVITTYTPKTLFLWALETVPADQWTIATVGDRVKDLMEDLRACVKKKYCPHYFIGDSNTLQQMDDKSCKVTLEVGFSMFDEDMADAPVLGSDTFETTSDFPVNFMFTYKSFYPINAWLESLNAQMMAKLDAPKKVPSEQNLADLLDSSKTHPILMTEILKYLVLSDEIYGQPLPVPKSLLQHEKITQLLKFLEKSCTTPEKYKECLEELEVELKFLHLQFKIIDEIQQFFTENPNFAYRFDSSSDESGSEGDQ